MLTGLIVLRTISAQARFAPREALFATLTLRAARNYVRYSATLRSYSGFVEMTKSCVARLYYFDDTRWFLSNFQVRMISSTSMFLRISAVKGSKGAASRTLWMAA